MKKVEGFTLVETLITMAVSVILFMVCIQFIGVANRLYAENKISMKQHYDLTNTAHRLNEDLWKAVELSCGSEVVISNNSETIIWKNSDQGCSRKVLLDGEEFVSLFPPKMKLDLVSKNVVLELNESSISIPLTKISK